MKKMIKLKLENRWMNWSQLTEWIECIKGPYYNLMAQHLSVYTVRSSLLNLKAVYLWLSLCHSIFCFSLALPHFITLSPFESPYLSCHFLPCLVFTGAVNFFMFPQHVNFLPDFLWFCRHYKKTWIVKRQKILNHVKFELKLWCNNHASSHTLYWPVKRDSFPNRWLTFDSFVLSGRVLHQKWLGWFNFWSSDQTKVISLILGNECFYQNTVPDNLPFMCDCQNGNYWSGVNIRYW